MPPRPLRASFEVLAILSHFGRSLGRACGLKPPGPPGGDQSNDNRASHLRLSFPLRNWSGKFRLYHGLHPRPMVEWRAAAGWPEHPCVSVEQTVVLQWLQGAQMSSIAQSGGTPVLRAQSLNTTIWNHLCRALDVILLLTSQLVCSAAGAVESKRGLLLHSFGREVRMWLRRHRLPPSYGSR
jgi:hypothetical protein